MAKSTGLAALVLLALAPGCWSFRPSAVVPPVVSVPLGDAYERFFAKRLVPEMRPDLKIGETKVEDARDVDPDELMKLLGGTWVREFTWFGINIPNEAALYFEVQPGKSGFRAAMYDQLAFGAGPMTRERRKITDSLERRAVTPTLTFIDTESLLVDKYYKLDEKLRFDGLPVDMRKVEARVARGRETMLEAVWEELNSMKFFDQRPRVPPEIAEMPGGELFTPFLVGAVWEGFITPVEVAGAMGVELRLNGEYRGSNFELGTAVKGFEDARFFGAGDLIIADSEVLKGWKKVITGPRGVGGIRLTWRRVVLDPARRGQP